MHAFKIVCENTHISHFEPIIHNRYSFYVRPEFQSRREKKELGKKITEKLFFRSTFQSQIKSFGLHFHHRYWQGVSNCFALLSIFHRPTTNLCYIQIFNFDHPFLQTIYKSRWARAPVNIISFITFVATSTRILKI